MPGNHLPKQPISYCLHFLLKKGACFALSRTETAVDCWLHLSALELIPARARQPSANKGEDTTVSMRTRGQETAIIIGSGPAGLTAALELCRRSSIRPIVLESSNQVGGLSCTIRYNGNRIDIVDHQSFSKSDRVMDCGELAA